MSSLLNFVLRRDGVLHQAVISSGGLSEVFNPLIFQGDPAAIAKFFERCTAEPMEAICPMGSGLVVVDVDLKKLWDVQVARELNVLSRRMDHSWLHLQSLEALGWIGTGLVDSETNNVIVPYPARGLTFEWHDKQVAAHDKRFKKSHPELNWDDPGMNEFMAMGRLEPRIPFAPVGWTLMKLPDAIEDATLQLAGLVADGFPIPDTDFKKWGDWIVAMAKRRAQAN